MERTRKKKRWKERELAKKRKRHKKIKIKVTDKIKRDIEIHKCEVQEKNIREKYMKRYADVLSPHEYNTVHIVQ